MFLQLAEAGFGGGAGGLGFVPLGFGGLARRYGFVQPGFGGVAGGLGDNPRGLFRGQGFLYQGHIAQVALRFAVVEPQVAGVVDVPIPCRMPAQAEIQGGAVAPDHSVRFRVYGNGLVLPVHQHFAGQGIAVEVAAGGVNPPVFLDFQAGVQVALESGVPFVGGFRGDFHYEVGGLAYFPDDKAVAPVDGGYVHAESHAQVGFNAPVHIVGVVVDYEGGAYQGVPLAGEMAGDEVAHLGDGGALTHFPWLRVGADVVVGQGWRRGADGWRWCDHRWRPHRRG